MIVVLQTAEPQKCYHVTAIFEPQTETNGPWSRLKKSACPWTSEMDNTTGVISLIPALDSEFLSVLTLPVALQKFGFIKRVDKGWITNVKDLESWRFEC